MRHRNVISFCWLRVDESSSLLAASFCPKSARLINLFKSPFGHYFQADLAFEMEFLIITAGVDRPEKKSIFIVKKSPRTEKGAACFARWQHYGGQLGWFLSGRFRHPVNARESGWHQQIANALSDNGSAPLDGQRYSIHGWTDELRILRPTTYDLQCLLQPVFICQKRRGGKLLFISA